MRSTDLLLVAVVALFSNSVVADTSDSQTDQVARTADGVWVGESYLLRTPTRVQAIVRTSDLDPGATMSVWWRIYNRPQHCATPFVCEVSDIDNPKVDGSQLHATAFEVSAANGAATVVASLYRTAAYAQGKTRFADALSEGYLKGRGLRRPMHAEVELLLASHGRSADPDVVGPTAAVDQLLTPGGTRLDCVDPNSPVAQRTFRCGVIQRVDHSGRASQ